jgi:hypothetical protein
MIEEITRYLAAVDAFRAAGCEPTWRPEPSFVAQRILTGSTDAHELPSARVH